MYIGELRIQGELSEKVHITFEIRKEGELTCEKTMVGTLKANEGLLNEYRQWQEQYKELIAIPRLEFEPQSQFHRLRQERNVLRQNCSQTETNLKNNFKRWLQESNDFQTIKLKLAELAGMSSNIRLMIRTDNVELQELPWHLCQFLEGKKIPFSLSPLKNEKATLALLKPSVRVLAIFGSNDGIDLAPDLETLNSNPNINLKVLIKPIRSEFAETLLENDGWDILFFAGHSQTIEGRGVLSLNANDSLSSDELEYHFRLAVSKGLKICILNSCDGSGLARHLISLGIPYVIYMREPIPDKIAHRFIESFMTYFSTGSNSIHYAFFNAKESLESIEDECPYATWLPTMIEQPQQQTLLWPQQKETNNYLRYFTYICLGLFPFLILLPHFLFNKSTQIVGDRISTGEEVLFESTAPKKSAAESVANEKLNDGINSYIESWDKDHKDPETLIYLNNTLIDKHEIPHTTVAVAVPSNPKDKTSKYGTSYQYLRGVAQAQTEVNKEILQSKLAQHPNGDKLTIFNLPNTYLNSNEKVKRALKVVVANDQNMEETAEEVANKIVKEPVVGLIGHYTSDTTKKALFTYQKYGLATISPSASTTSLTEDFDVFHRVTPNTINEASAITNQFQKKQISKVYVFYTPGSVFAHALYSEFVNISNGIDNIEVDGKVRPNNVLRNLGLNEFDAEEAIKRLREDNKYNMKDVGILLIPDGEDQSAETNSSKLIKENAGDFYIVGSWGVDNPKTLEYLTEVNAGEQTLAVMLPWHLSNEDNSPFLVNAIKLWGKEDVENNNIINGETALAYDSAIALIRAQQILFKKNIPVNRAHINQELKDPGFKVEGASGEIAFEKNGERSSPPILIIENAKCTPPKNDHIFLPLDKSCPK